MTTKQETLFYKRVHKHLPLWVYFEKSNNPYVSGPADVYYEGRHGRIAWVEYKILEAWPVRATTTVSAAKVTSKKTWARQDQWLTRAWDNKIATAVFLSVPGAQVAVFDSPAVWGREWMRHELNLVEELHAALWIVHRLEEGNETVGSAENNRRAEQHESDA